MRAGCAITRGVGWALMIVLAAQFIPAPAASSAAAAIWYVAPTGDDGNTCHSPAAPCRTINAAIARASDGDTILIAAGSYSTTAGSEVVHIDRDLTLSGGWNAAFSSQTGRSVIDGGGARRGITIPSGGRTVSLTRLVVQNGASGAAEYGGGIAVFSAAEVVISGSAVIDNESAGPGGGIYSENSDLIVVNSTISGNHSGGNGGGIAKSGSAGSLQTYNATVSMNSADSQGGGIWGADSIVLKNSIVAGNTAPGTGPDCYLSGESDFSGGYNLIEKNSGCDFVAKTGDLIGIDARLGWLQDNGGATFTHALLPGSLAVNHGDPAGCSGPLGEPLTTDQRGVTRDGWCDIGAYEQPFPQGIYRVFLPCILNRPCVPDHLDDFNDEGSGWPDEEDQTARTVYNSGEYQILVKQTGWWTGVRPNLTMTDVVLQVDVRSVSGVYGSYGLIFSLADDWTDFYAFEIDPDGYYAVMRYRLISGWETLAAGHSDAIRTGAAVNRLKIERNWKMIWVYANGRLLNILSEEYFAVPRYAGLIAAAYGEPNVDVRFDNFKVYPISCGASSSYLTGLTAGTTEPPVEADGGGDWKTEPHRRDGLK